MELKNNQVVLNKRGEYGVVVSFNNEPSLIVYKTYTMQLSKFDENLQAKNDAYSIDKVYDAPPTLKMNDVFSKTFKGFDEDNVI